MSNPFSAAVHRATRTQRGRGNWSAGWVFLDRQPRPLVADAVVTNNREAACHADALFPSQNLVTIGAVRALHQTGRQHDTALIGFDDVPFAETFHPGITVIAQRHRGNRADSCREGPRPDWR